MSRRRKRRSSRQPRRLVPDPAAGQTDPFWVDVFGRRMFVVGYTPAGFPYGVYEDEMDAGTYDFGLDNGDEPY